MGNKCAVEVIQLNKLFEKWMSSFVWTYIIQSNFLFFIFSDCEKMICGSPKSIFSVLIHEFYLIAYFVSTPL